MSSIEPHDVSVSPPARDPVREQYVELSQLAGGLAHEIRNPLSTIGMNLKLLAEDLARHDDETHRRYLRRLELVQNETSRVREILEDFLHYAREQSLNRQSLDLRDVVEELTDFFRPQAESARVVMRTDLPEQPVTVSVDEDLLKQALLNLLINAIQAMDDGGELLVRLGLEARQAQLEVIDSGPGIEPEERARIFQAYYSTKSDGTGLGLPTTRRIIRQHGGNVEVDSQPGHGTRFVIRLPADGGDPATPPAD